MGRASIGHLAIGHSAIGTLAIGQLAMCILAINVYRHSITNKVTVFHVCLNFRQN